jgi:phage baseplate assembly protein W
MPTYIGFSTIGANEPKTTNASTGIDGGTGGVLQPTIPGKKYRLVDEALVVRDFVNALNIQQGQKVGNPGYGSIIWSFIFEPNDAQTQFRLENEIRRIANGDPRLIINTVKSYPQENGILLEVELAIAPFNNAEILNVFFNNLTNTATLQ